MLAPEGATNEDDIWMPRKKKSRQKTFLWAPAPSAADVAIEGLRKARHKCTANMMPDKSDK